MYTVYILENEHQKFYIGFSQDVEKRLKSHNQSHGPDWTQGKGTWKIIYTENFSTEREAKQRENKLKSLKAGKRIKDILKITL